MKTVDVGIILLVSLLAFLVIGSLVGAGVFENTPFSDVLKSKDKVECDVTVKRSAWGVGGAYIDAVDCAVVDTCYLGYAVAPFITVAAKEGEVRLYMDSTLDDREHYEVGLLQTKTYKLKACTDSNQARIQLIDEQGQVLQTETRSVS